MFVQLCGWIGAYDLFPGAISDTQYFNDAGIFEHQQHFQQADGGVPFLNIVDRGYRITKAAWQRNQLILQPIFSKSDAKFTTEDTLKSASIAADRSGNERSVRLCKNAHSLIHHGRNLKNSHEIERFCNLWLAHSFQVNFMFKNVM